MLYNWMMSLLKQKGDMEKEKSSLEKKRWTQKSSIVLLEIVLAEDVV